MRALVYVAVIIVCEWLMRRHLHPLDLVHWSRPWRWVVYTIVIWTILYDGTGGVKAFIYFQF
jgi:hypothetical protein